MAPGLLMLLAGVFIITRTVVHDSSTSAKHPHGMTLVDHILELGGGSASTPSPAPASPAPAASGTHFPAVPGVAWDPNYSLAFSRLAHQPAPAASDRMMKDPFAGFSTVHSPFAP